jgi:AcrR family transcriptional regulator
MSVRPTDGRQVRWEQHNVERRAAILTAAIEVIEATPTGDEVNVARIAERAGVGRTVIYRHFADRAELDREIRVAVLNDVWDHLLPVLTLQGSIPQIVERAVAAYVGWADAHPALHHVAVTTEPGGANPLDEGVAVIADRVVELIETAVDILRLDLSDDDRAAVDPLVHGFVGAVFGVVRRWLARPVREPSAQVLVELTTASVWFQLQGHARALGLELLADQPIEELLAGISPEATT